jgi:methyl-accepting chemotaxis protein
MKFLGRLKLWQKLAVLVVAMAVPTALLQAFYLSQVNKVVQTGRDELDGARYLQALGAVVTRVADHRSLSHALLNGDASRKSEIDAAQAEIDKLMGGVDVLDAELGANYQTTQRWKSVQSSWSALKAGLAKLTPDNSLAQHDELLDRMGEIRTAVAMISKLSLDDDQSTYTLINIATEQVSQAIHELGDMRRHAIGAAVKGYLGGDDRIAIEIYSTNLSEALERVGNNLQYANPDAKAEVGSALETVKRSLEGFQSHIQTKIVSAEKMEVTASEVFNAGSPVSNSLEALSTISYAAMKSSIEKRLSGEITRRNATVGIVILVLAVALALAWLITRAMTKPMSQAISVFGSISAGHYDNTIEHAGSDEAGQVLQALDEMQSKLHGQIEAERTAAAENSRLRAALDKTSASVMVADDDFKIIYLNDAAQRLFRDAQNDFRREVPALDAAHMLGSSIDMFSKNPSQQRQLLTGLRSAHTSVERFGDRIINLTSNPVLDGSGKWLGTVLEWVDRTQEVRSEEEVQAIVKNALDGDLRRRVDLQGKRGFFEVLGRGLNQLLDNMAEIIQQIKTSATDVHRGAEEISQGNANLSQRTEQQSSSLEETASSMEEMTSTVKQNADNAGQANQLAMAARDQAEKGGAVVAKAVRAMTDINDASTKIADIIGVIDEIAFQTNLLALNAAVEAARAGEQGRGFAVVASEVRSLAGRSATAAKEIKELIQDSVKKVEDGSVLVTQSGQTLEQIVSSVKKVSDIVAEIAAASREQSSGIEQVNRAVMQMDELTQQNAALVEQATAASQAMAEQARELNDMMGRYVTDGTGQITSSAMARPAARSASSAPAVERRSASRPWNNRTAKAADAASAPPPPVEVASRKVANGSATEWEEF